MSKLYSYVLRYDDGAAPNPFWGTCTLTICKPDIRRTAQIGDWVIGTGSKNSRLKDGFTHDFSELLVYAMKVTDKKTLAEYDSYCQKSLPKKIPKENSKDYRRQVGDCIYDYSKGSTPIQRLGIHSELNKDTDLRGKNALLSNHFYFFGENPILIPTNLKHIIKKGQKHRVITHDQTIKLFEKWISQFTVNRIYRFPQLKFEFADGISDELLSKCSSRHHDSDC